MPSFLLLCASLFCHSPSPTESGAILRPAIIKANQHYQVITNKTWCVIFGFFEVLLEACTNPPSECYSPRLPL